MHRGMTTIKLLAQLVGGVLLACALLLVLVSAVWA
jgi:hypothetical protein